MISPYTERESYPAIQAHFNRLPPAEQMALSLAAKVLASGIKGLGEASAKEILYQIGRLLNDNRNPPR